MGRVKAFDRHCNMILENVKEMWSEVRLQALGVLQRLLSACLTNCSAGQPVQFQLAGMGWPAAFLQGLHRYKGSQEGGSAAPTLPTKVPWCAGAKNWQGPEGCTTCQ